MNARQGRLTSCLSAAGLALWMLLAGAGWAVGQVPSTGSPQSPAARPAPDGPGVARRVLLLYSESRLTPAIVTLDARVRSIMESRSPVPVTFYTEYLDLNLFDGNVPLPELYELLRRKYATRPLDLIIPATSRALRVALHNRGALFSNAPVVFVGVDPDAAADLRLDADVTGTWLRQGWAETLELARRLQPEVRRAVVVTGSSQADRVYAAGARKYLAAARPIEVTYLTDLGMEDVLREVRGLPRHAVVLVGVFFRDAGGRDFRTPDAIRQIAAAASVPVYGLNDSALGTGAVGGHVASFEAHSQAAVDLALRMLAGERPAPTDAGTSVPMVDARQLARWGLDARRLPAGSVVMFREPSLWDQYRWHVVAAVSVLLVQGGLIGGLLVHRAQRRRAQARLAESVVQIQTLAGRLITAQEEERRRIARELHDGVNQELSALSIALTRLGHRPPSRAADLTDELARLQERAAGLVEEVRELSHEIHPGVLQHVGLVAALEGHCEEFGHEHGLAVTFRADGDLGDVPMDRALCLYRATQEALGNVARHAKASHARVSVARDHDDVRLTIADDGCGFDLTEARSRGGLGLISLDERARLVGGQVTIRTEPQGGTEVRILVPLRGNPDASPDGPDR